MLLGQGVRRSRQRCEGEVWMPFDAFFDFIIGIITLCFWYDSGSGVQNRKKKYEERKVFCTFLPRHCPDISFNWSIFLLPITQIFFSEKNNICCSHAVQYEWCNLNYIWPIQLKKSIHLFPEWLLNTRVLKASCQCISRSNPMKKANCKRIESYKTIKILHKHH